MKANFFSFACIALAFVISAAASARAQAVAADPSPTSPLKEAALLAQGLQQFRAEKYGDAIASYRSVLASDPNSAEAYAQIARCLLEQEDVTKAAEAAQKAVALVPSDPDAHTALAEVLFRQGNIFEADKELVGVVNGPNPPARAFLDLSRIYTAIAIHQRSKAMIDRAHELDKTDPEITRRWIFTLPPQQAETEMKKLLASFAGSADERDELNNALIVLESDLARDDCTIVKKPEHAELALQPVMMDALHFEGVAIETKLDGERAKLELDTGADGIILNPNIAKKAHIAPLVQGRLAGIGDEGDQASYYGYADSVQIGGLEFRHCLVEVSSRKSITEDGSIGGDFFSDFLVDLDLPDSKLKLGPLPEPPGSERDAHSQDTRVFHDRYIAPEMKSYTPVFQFGHDLLVPVRVNKAKPALFMLDTGANDNFIDATYARTATKVYSDWDSSVKGESGYVKKVYAADSARLQFGHFAQENQELTSFDYSRLSADTGTEISGTLGFVLLHLLDTKIDYRDGLVDFNYDPKRWREAGPGHEW